MAFLEVVIPPDIIYEETSGDMMVPEGGSAKLVCKARGFPRPKVVWRREDGADIIVRSTSKSKTTSAVEPGQGISTYIIEWLIGKLLWQSLLLASYNNIQLKYPYLRVKSISLIH